MMFKSGNSLHIKTRLQKKLSKHDISTFNNLAFESLKRVMLDLKATSNESVSLILSPSENFDESLIEKDFIKIEQSQGNLSSRIYALYSLLIKNYSKVIVIGSDSPQICPENLSEASDKLNDCDFVLGPAKDGGYYLFGGSKPLLENIWEPVRHSSVHAFNDLKIEAEKSGSLKVLFRKTDVDYFEDLALLKEELLQINANSYQAKLLRWINEGFDNNTHL